MAPRWAHQKSGALHTYWQQMLRPARRSPSAHAIGNLGYYMLDASLGRISHYSDINQPNLWNGIAYSHEELEENSISTSSGRFITNNGPGWGYDPRSTLLDHGRSEAMQAFSPGQMLPELSNTVLQSSTHHTVLNRAGEINISGVGRVSAEPNQTDAVLPGNKSNFSEISTFLGSPPSDYYTSVFPGPTSNPYTDGREYNESRVPSNQSDLDWTTSMTPDQGIFTQTSNFSTSHNVSSESYPVRRKQPVKRVGPDCGLLEQAFSLRSNFPNAALEHLVKLINGSLFLWMHEMEPLIGSDEGKELLKMVSYLPGYPPLVHLQHKQSIYAVLVDSAKRTCLICGSVKGSLERAISCIRSHLDHRPFACGGQSVGCFTCKDKSCPARFFSSSLLEDHINGQLKKIKCLHNKCDASLRRGGMRRHWSAKHKEDPFPRNLYPRYGSP